MQKQSPWTRYDKESDRARIQKGKASFIDKEHICRQRVRQSQSGVADRGSEVR